MARRAERGDVLGPEVLHLVDEDGDPAPQVGGKPADIGQQFHQVDLDVARVGPAGDGGGVDAGIPAVAQLRIRGGLALRERLHHPQHVVHLVELRMPELPHRDMRRGGDRAPERLVRARLKLPCAPTGSDCLAAKSVEQHGLSDAPQTGEDQRALGAPLRHAVQHDIELGKLLITAGQLGRALTGTGRIRVPDRVHDWTVCQCLTFSADSPPTRRSCPRSRPAKHLSPARRS